MSVHASQAFSIAHCTDSKDFAQSTDPHYTPIIFQLRPGFNKSAVMPKYVRYSFFILPTLTVCRNTASD